MIITDRAKIRFLVIQPERLNSETCDNKLVYREPNLETMSPHMKAKYDLAKKLLQDGIEWARYKI
jgi:hypothetical protein